VAREASGGRIGVAPHILVFLIHLGLPMLMAGQAADRGVVGRGRVAIGAAVPLLTMRPGVDREVLPVVIERGWLPPRLGVARGAVRRKARGGVRRLVLGLMTDHAVVDGGGPRERESVRRHDMT